VLVVQGDQARVVGVELDAVVVPHWELRFGVVAVAPPGVMIPGPGFVRVERVEFGLQVPGCYAPDVGVEVAVNVVGMLFGFDEGAVEVDFRDSDLPELLDQQFCLVDQVLAPGSVELEVLGAVHEYGVAELIEVHSVVSCGEQSASVEIGNQTTTSTSRVRIAYISPRVSPGV
jgi:hypothetical protein